MIWRRVLLGTTCFFWIAIALGANARTETDTAKAYYVVLDSPPMLMHQQRISEGAPIRSTRFKAKRTQARTYLQSLVVQQNTLAQRIQSLDPNARVLSRFNRLVNALVVKIDPALRADILQLPGVTHVSPVRRMKPFMTESNQLMNVPQAWDASLLGEDAGDGVFIAIVDTGIDSTHPAFEPSGLYVSRRFSQRG